MMYKFVGVTLAKMRMNQGFKKGFGNGFSRLISSRSPITNQQIPTVTSADIRESVNEFIGTADNDEYLKKVFEPRTMLLTREFKSLYPSYIESINHWTKCTKEQCDFAVNFIDLMFDHFIMLDDAIDKGDKRDGESSPFGIYGSERCFLSAMALLMEAVRKLNALGNAKLLDEVCKNILAIHAFVYVQVDHTFAYSCPTLKEGIQILIGRGAFWYSIMFQLLHGMSEYECVKDIRKVIFLTGILHSLINDCVNISQNKDTFLYDKNFAEDISVGQFSFPIVLAIQKDSPEKNIMLNILRQKSKDPQLLSICVDLVEKLGCLEEAKHIESIVYQMIMEEIELLGGNPKLIATIDTFRKWRTDKLAKNTTAYKRHCQE